MDETEETQEEIDIAEAIEEPEVQEPPEPVDAAAPNPPDPPEPEPEAAEELAAEEEASEVSSKPYWQQVYDGDIEGPAFKHVDSEGNFTDYTLEEVLASDKTNAHKAAYLRDCIGGFKDELAATDYIALKLAEGAATADEYTEQIAARQTLRDTINTYQDAIETLNTEE